MRTRRTREHHIGSTAVEVIAHTIERGRISGQQHQVNYYGLQAPPRDHCPGEVPYQARPHLA